jgi:N-acetylglutamate synthase-like GNAT family acetyltransferase
MNPSAYRVRRATVDDLPGLVPLWESLRLPADELERRLTEFQLIEMEDGTLLGALGLEAAGRHGLLHSEVFNDFALADGLRVLLWERMQSIASNLGLTRLWTVESSLFWKREGFEPGGRETLEKLPSVWAQRPGDWLTIELRDEEALRAAVETAYARLKQEHIQESQAVLRHARVWKFIAIALGLVVALAGILFCIYLLRQYPRLLHSSG